MKEQRIIAFIGTYACLNLANTSKGEIYPWFWIAFAIFWVVRLFYLRWSE